MAMSAMELLKNVEALSARERAKFVRAVLTLQDKVEAVSVSRAGKANHVKWPDIEARARRIFGNRQLPNVVLLERAEQVF